MSHVANAALPVAVALLVLTAIARGVLWSGIQGEEQRIAAKHLEALGAWCLVATGTYAVATIAAGQLSVVGIGAAIVMAVAALLLRTEEPTANEPVQQEPERAVRRSPEPVPTHVQTPAPKPKSLWEEPSAESTPRPGLWAR
jgi:hypothetical protein